MLLVLLLLDEAEALIAAVFLCKLLEGCPVENRDFGELGPSQATPGLLDLDPHQK